MQDFIKKYGRYLLTLLFFLSLVIIYFSPSIIDGKTIRQGDSMKFVGMVQELSDYYNKEGKTSQWIGSMFSGMPAYQVGMPGTPTSPISYLTNLVKGIDPMGAGIVLAGLISFYILMCIIGVNRWLAIAGAIAYTFASYNFIIIEAGHISKAYAIAFMPLTIAGMLLLFNKKLIWGSVIFILGVAFSIMEGHLQITYYLAIFCIFIYLYFLFKEIKEKRYKELLKTTGILIISLLIAVLPNLANLYGNYEMSKTSIRGATELTTTSAEGEKISSGLDKDYAFAWSYGKSELLTLLIPNAYGGATGGTLDNTSELYKELRAKGAQVGKDIQTYTYWGDKSFTSGPVYFGALVCFLFVLGMFFIKNPLKWWLFGGAVFMAFLSLGRNLDWFNDFMFHYLPMYNKFRTVEMALVIPGLVAPIIAFWGLKELFSGQVDAKSFKKGMIWSLGITGGLCLIVWWMPSLLLSFQSSYDAQYQMPDWYYNALLMDRKALASADALRSLVFILAGAGLLYWYFKAKNKKTATTIVSAIIAILILADLWSVDKRYLNGSNFVREKIYEPYKETVADKAILADKDPSYRVINLNNPFQETNTSYFHKSIGGYHAAKLRRYQELIDHRLAGELSSIITVIQKAQSLEEVTASFAQCPSLNMLNTRYVIYNPEQPPLRNPYAFGNAWFVGKVEIVENADAEIAALNAINPLETAVVDKRFADDLAGFTPQLDSTATIKLDSYHPNQLTYTSKTATEQLAVFSEIYYQPGWKVTIDGEPASHFRADWTLRAMRIPAGEHQIVFEFHPDRYVMAANISSYGSFLILLLLAVAIGYSIWKEIKGNRQGKKVSE